MGEAEVMSRGLFSFILLLCIWVPSILFAEDRSVLWDVRCEGASVEECEQAKSTLKIVLGRSDERHYFSDGGLKRKIERDGISLPICFDDGSVCSTGSGFVLEVFNVDGLVEAVVGRVDGQWTFAYSFVQRYSGNTTKVENRSKNLEKLLVDSVGSLFSLESELVFKTNPVGAQVFLNGDFAGVSPVNVKVKEGSQQYVIRKDGFVDLEGSVESVKGESKVLDLSLAMKTIKLTVKTSDPEAEIWIDGALWGKSGEEAEVLPGEHEVKVVPKGEYHESVQRLKLFSSHSQQIEIALLPISKASWVIRQRGIDEYRFHIFAGYFFRYHESNYRGGKFDDDGYRYKTVYFGDSQESMLSSIIHGVRFGIGYRSKFFAIDIADMYLGWSKASSKVRFNDTSLEKQMDLEADSVFMFNIYPAVFRLHYLFYTFSVGVGAGLGYSRSSLSLEKGKKVIEHLGSFHFDAGLKYFLSEESYLGVDYSVEKDFGGGVGSKTGIRHGLSVIFGLQLDIFRRGKDKDLVKEVKGQEELEDLTSEVPGEGEADSKDKLQVGEQGGSDGI